MANLDYLEKLPFWSWLKADEKELIKANSVIRKYTKGRLIQYGE